MYIRLICLSLVLLISFGCKEKSASSRTEVLEIFAVKGGANDKVADSLKYFESTEWVGGRKISTTFYNSKGDIQGREELAYNGDDIYKGHYFDPKGKLLSYYDYIHDNEGTLLAEYGFDASNHELLSIKAYEYDRYGNIAKQKVFNSDYSLYRLYNFVTDSIGNERIMNVLNANDSLLFSEIYENTVVDSTGNWVERWGFVEDIPVTFYKRSF